MKHIRSYLLSAVLLMPGFAASQTPDVREIPVRIAGGQTVQVKVGPRGAKPAENERVRITAAAIIITPPDTLDGHPSLVWSFGLTAKTADPITRITVENVFPSDPAVLLHTDETPRLTEGNWTGQANNGDPMAKQNGWLQQKGLSAFVFRFTLRYQDGTEGVLHQLAAFGDDDKRFFLDATRQASERFNIKNSQ